MKNFKKYLDATGEIGFVQQSVRSIVYASGLPQVKPGEVVSFETEEEGLVISIGNDYVEILLLSAGDVKVGTKIARKNDLLQIAISDSLLGKTVNALGYFQGKALGGVNSELRYIDPEPPGINARKNIGKPLQTGVSLVDLIVPLGKGQRQLIVGDRKTGKTQLLMQTVKTQASEGVVCIYAAIAKKKLDIKMIEEDFKAKGILKNTIIVASSSSDPAGMIYLSPYTAMTIAEFFRDQGKDVFIVMDDLTAHASYYREISLLAKRFPGRSSYPGDIFYAHSRLLERAGNFQFIKKEDNGKLFKSEVSITCMPVAELVLGDLSGYIQTNLMAMTDGHIFFDTNLFNQGRRPAINPFLSVTRVGRQAQSPLLRDLNRQVTSFMVYLEKLRDFMHFGAELSESTRRTLGLGDRITSFFDQSADVTVPVNISVAILAGLWGGLWKNSTLSNMKREISDVVDAYLGDSKYKTEIDKLITDSKSFEDIVGAIKSNQNLIISKIKNQKTSGGRVQAAAVLDTTQNMEI